MEETLLSATEAVDYLSKRLKSFSYNSLNYNCRMKKLKPNYTFGDGRRYFKVDTLEQFIHRADGLLTLAQIGSKYLVNVRNVHYAFRVKRQVEPDLCCGKMYYSKEKVEMVAKAEGW